MNDPKPRGRGLVIHCRNAPVSTGPRLRYVDVLPPAEVPPLAVRGMRDMARHQVISTTCLASMHGLVV